MTQIMEDQDPGLVPRPGGRIEFKSSFKLVMILVPGTGITFKLTRPGRAGPGDSPGQGPRLGLSTELRLAGAACGRGGRAAPRRRPLTAAAAATGSSGLTLARRRVHHRDRDRGWPDRR